MKRKLIISTVAMTLMMGSGIMAFANENVSEASTEISLQQESSYNNGYVSGDKVNFRKGPSTDSERYKLLSKNTRITILGYEGEWTKIKTNNVVGYVYSDYINKDNVDIEAINIDESKTIAMDVKATAYSGDGITSTGNVPMWGTVAVDPSIIPYGSRVYIPELDKVFVAEDCGSAIKGNRIDIFMDSEQSCNQWGVKDITIYVLG